MKKGHRLGELSKLLDLQPYVLRYWLTEFPSLRGDEAGSSGNRLFSADEVALLRRIKSLLYDEGYTIAGAKKKLESEPFEPAGVARRTAAAPLFDADDEPAEEELAAAETPPAEETADASRRLDTRDDERIESLQKGIAKALDEARAILELLKARR